LFFWAPFLAVIGVVVMNTTLGWRFFDPFYVFYILLPFFVVTAFGTTLCYHRYLTHKSFDTYVPIQFLMYICAYMAVQGDALTWCKTHYQHHRESDGARDPHPAIPIGGGWQGILRGLWYAHIGWMFDKICIIPNDCSRRLSKDRLVCFFDKTILFWIILSFVLPAYIGYVHEGSWKGLVYGFVWGGLVRIFFHQHITSCVNSICHYAGSRDFRTPNNCNSSNCWWLSLVTLGESGHNGHHAFESSALHWIDRPYLDPTYWVICLGEMTGLMWNVRRPSKDTIERLRIKKS
jgi:stearoyl-CoA desaturase (delta-9 desaturase)